MPGCFRQWIYLGGKFSALVMRIKELEQWNGEVME
jgi:hypothetical protein